MQFKSHISLAVYLVNTLNNRNLKLFQKAFMFGCVSPDINVLSYLKGSFKNKPLKGHHYKSSYTLVNRKLSMLQKKKRLSLIDYYEIGKVVHYIADNFTYPHNDNYSKSISEHCKYEKELHSHLESYLSNKKEEVKKDKTILSVKEYLDENHNKYCGEEPSFQRDSIYVTEVSETVVTRLLSA